MYTNFVTVTVVLALFSNVSVTFESGVQIFSYYMHAFIIPSHDSHTIQFALLGLAPFLLGLLDSDNTGQHTI